MNIVMNKEVLVSALNTVDRVVTANASLPILTGILMEATDSFITFTASNGDESIIHEIEVDNLQVTVNEAGKTVVPGNLLTIAKKLGKDITLSVNDANMTVQSGKSRFELSTMDSQEFPNVKADVNQPSLTLNYDELKDMIEKTAYAAATSDTRPILQGVNFHLNGKAQVACTDSLRLAYVVRQGEFSEEIQVTIPAKALLNLSKVMNEGDVDIYLQEHQVVFKNEQITYSSRLLDGNYPEIERLMPKGYQTNIKFKTSDVKEALERVSIVGDKTPIVKFTAQNGDCVLQLNKETSKVKDQLEPLEYQGDEVSLSFNSAYAMAALKTIDTDEVTFNFQGDMKPFTVTSPDNDSDLQLIMPVRNY